MKTAANRKRPYRMGARAEAAAATERRIFTATRELASGRLFAQVTLDDIASRAGVTVQTVIRRYGSKDALLRAIAEAVHAEVREQRFEAPVGDIRGAVANLVEHYEDTGDETYRLLCQEEQVPVLGEVLSAGRAMHRDWVTRVFAPWLKQLRGAERARRTAELVAICDLFTWKLLRRDLGLSRTQTEHAIREMLERVLR
ncbi:MAG TPA: helix-turn-helix domain-containing protein [Thermoleophilaceae bacterium]|nr:helix-turn-helix domain-containing protein [Thermoleophilaceae bacterium]